MQADDRRTIEVLVFQIGGERYGLPAAEVREVLPAATLAAPPGGRLGLLGILNLRGQAVPILDLRPLLGQACGPLLPTEHFIIARAGGTWLGLRADTADALVVAEWDAEATSHIRRQWDYLAGVARTGDDLVLVLDPRRLWERCANAAVQSAGTFSISSP